MTHPLLKTVLSDGCQSYIIGCPETRECLLVDPKVGREASYKALLKRMNLKLVAVLDTHTHADHLSASTRFCGTGVELLMSKDTTVDRPKRALAGGDEVEIGNMRFQVLQVPGHTPDSIALFGQGVVFTGDSLLNGGLGRADFVGSDPAQLFESVKTQLMALPSETLVMPGHDYQDVLFTTIGAESNLNKSLAHADGAAYAASLKAKAGAGNSDAVNATLKLNLQRDPELPESPGNVAACCASAGGSSKVTIEEVSPQEALPIRDALPAADRWLDVRDAAEYESGRIDGTTNSPLSELGFHLSELKTSDPLYLSCRTGVRSLTAAKTLLRLGVVTHPINIGGGIVGWQDAGNPILGTPAK